MLSCDQNFLTADWKQRSVKCASSETQGQIAEARESQNGRKKMATKNNIVGREEPWGQVLTRPVPNSTGHSQFWLVPEILCVFLPNQRSAGREVVSCLLTRKSLDILALVRLARFCSRRKVSITAQNVQGIVRNIDGEIRWTFCRYWYSSVFPSVRDLFKDVLTD